MNRITDRTDTYRARLAAHHRHETATAARNRLALETVTRKAATSSSSFLRALAARAAHQLSNSEALSSERQALQRRLGGTEQ